MRLINIWRFMVAATDYRRGARLLSGNSKLDVVFISNVRDEEERTLFFKPGASNMVQDNGPRIHINGVAGQIRAINFTAEEMYSRKGRKPAKVAFIEAVKWAEQQGAKVILLAASTKRLFGHDGKQLKTMFPNMLFTIGDNGTSHLLCSDVDRALQHNSFAERQPRILVVGAYGILGSALCEHLQREGHDLIGFGNNPVWLKNLQEKTGITVINNLQDAGKVDLVVTCTHGAESKLTVQCVEQLRRHNHKLLVIDVAEPANLDCIVYEQCKKQVIRQDAGNGYSTDLHYVLGALTYKQMNLHKGTIFGCFAEAMALYHSIYKENNQELLQKNWFDVNPENQAIIADAFQSINIGLPTPHCFGKKVADLNIKNNSQHQPLLNTDANLEVVK